MCGRYTHLYTWKQLHRLLELTTPVPAGELPRRYNVAPSQSAPVVRAICEDPGVRASDAPAGDAADEPRGRVGGRSDARSRGRGVSMMRWGLIPSWAKDASIGARTVNARCETLSEKPAFRAAFKKRRCLVPISGFYEWKVIEGAAKGKAKQPYYITSSDGEPLVLAGLWESWRDPSADQAQSIESFTILTTSPNELMATFHDRMPVIIPREHFARWLDPANEDTASLADLFKPYPAELMMAMAVSTRVNSPKNDDALCIEPIRPDPDSRVARGGMASPTDPQPPEPGFLF